MSHISQLALSRVCSPYDDNLYRSSSPLVSFEQRLMVWVATLTRNPLSYDLAQGNTQKLIFGVIDHPNQHIESPDFTHSVSLPDRDL